MPRVNRKRDTALEVNVAERIEYERNKRGWSYLGLAKRVTDAGCDIGHYSAIQKIERGQPRRKVLLSELVAFSTVFEIPLAEMFIPLASVKDQEVRRISESLDSAFDRLAGASEEIINLYVEVLNLAVDDVLAEVDAMDRGDSVLDRIFGESVGDGLRSIALTDASDEVEAKFRDVLLAFNLGLLDTADLHSGQVRESKPPKTSKSRKGSKR